MSLIEVRLIDVVKKQVQFKLKSYLGIFHSLIILQIFGLFLSTLGVSNMTEPGYGRSISVDYFNNGVLIGITAVWLFINTLLLTTKAYREDDFTFVSTRKSRLLADVCFIVLLALLGTVTSLLATNVLKVLLSFSHVDLIVTNSLSFFTIMTTLLMVLSYFILVGAIAYTIGSIIQRNKLVAIVLSMMFIIIGMISIIIGGEEKQIDLLISFFTKEPVFIFLLIKIFLANGLLFFISWKVANNQEVRV